MAIINRDYLLIVDVRQSNINFNKDKIMFYITDKNTSNIFVNLATNISDNDYVDNYVSIEDAQNYKVTMNIVKPDNTYKIIEGTLLDEKEALYEFNLEEECKDQIGTYTCDIQSIRVDDEVERIITSNRFLYKVKAGVLNDLNEVIQSAESYPIVVELFDKLSYIERYEDERQANEEARSEAEEQRQNRYDGLIDTILSRIQSMDDKLIEVEERLTSKEQEVDNCIEENTTKMDAKIQETDNKINELDTMFSENLDTVNEKINETNAKLVEMDKSMITNTSKINAKINEANNVIDEMKTSITNNTAKVDAKLGDVEKRISTKENEVDNYISSAKTTLNTYQNTTTNRIDNYLRDKSVALDKYQANKDIVINNKLNDALTQIDEKLANIDMSDIDLTGYAKTEDIPTNLSQLTNDSDFVNSTFVTTKIAEAQLSGGEVDLSEYAKTSDIPHVISEEVVFTIPNSSLLTIFDESGEPKELVYDTDIIGLNQTELYYVVEFNGDKFLVKPSYNSYSDQTGITLQMNYSEEAWWYLEIHDKANANWDTDATKTRIGFSTEGITDAITTDLLIKKININYLDNNVLNPNTRILNSLQIGLDSGIIEHDAYEADFGVNSLSVGEGSKALGTNSTAMGLKTTASGKHSHAEGNSTTANGESSHAEGDTTTASGRYSHTEGFHTIASSVYQHVQGRYNINDSTNTYAHIVGNGRSESTRSNAYTLDWNGNGWYKGKLSQDGTPTENRDLTTKEYVDNAIGNIDASNMTITDTGNYFTNSNVEGALQEVGSQIKDITNEIQQSGIGIIFENVEDGEVMTSVEEVIECTSISLDKTELSFTDTTPQTLVATTEPSNTTEKVVWSIDDESVVNVNDGVITPLKNGNAVITATCGSQSVSCDVTVSAIITRYSVVNNLTNCSNSNSATSIEENSSYSANISANEGYELGEVTCTMGGVAQTVTDGAINIASVTGDIIITAKATQSSIALPSEDSDKFYIQDGYAYIDPRTLNRHSLTSMNYDDTSDTEKATVSFNLAPANRYEKTSEVLFNDFIPYNDTSATSYYYFNYTAIYAKIPRSEYVNANSDINQVLYKMFVRLPIKLSTTLTEYPLTTDIIDSITGSVATGQNENGYYNGFVNLPSTGIGIIDTNRTFCNKFGAISDILSTNKEDYAIKITTRFYYNVPAYKFPDGFTLDAFKTYLKSLELVFYY